jgi:hypothetical protein
MTVNIHFYESCSNSVLHISNWPHRLWCKMAPNQGLRDLLELGARNTKDRHDFLCLTFGGWGSLYHIMTRPSYSVGSCQMLMNDRLIIAEFTFHHVLTFYRNQLELARRQEASYQRRDGHHVATIPPFTCCQVLPSGEFFTLHRSTLPLHRRRPF